MLIEKLPEPLNRVDGKYCTSRTLQRHETLFTQGQATVGFYYLMSGGLDLKRTSLEGHNVLIHRARAKDTFAEASLFSDRYHCSATSISASLVIEFAKKEVLRLLHDDAGFSNLMLQRFAGQVQKNRRLVELLSIRSARERILGALNDGPVVEEIVSFAATIGLAPETVSRNLAKLAEEGVVVKTARGHYSLVKK